MKTNVRPFLGAALALLAAAGLPAQEKMTLKAAVDLLAASSPAVQAAAESVTGAALKIDESKSLYWPQATINGGYTRMSLFGEFQIPYQGQMMTIKFGTPNNYNFIGTVSAQVFNWGRTARTVDLGRAGLDLAQDGLAMTRFMLGYQVVPLYYGVAFFREAVKVVDDNLRQFEAKREVMKVRFDAGLASDFDLQLVDVQMSGLRAQRLDFENNIAKFRTTFNTLAGRDPAAPFDPAEGLAFVPVAAAEDALLAEAAANRLEFRQTAHQARLNQASLDLAKTGNKPTLVAAFNYQFRNGFMPEMDKIKGNWTATVSLSYPAFDGFRVRTQVAEAESALRTTEAKKTDLERSVAVEIRNALNDLRTVEAKIEIEKVKIAQAESALRIAEERYRGGLLSATDLVDAQNMLEGAKLNCLQLVYAHILGKYGLDRSCGRKL